MTRKTALTSPVPPSEDVDETTETVPERKRRGAPVSLLAKAGRALESANRRYEKLAVKRDQLADELSELQATLDTLVQLRDDARSTLEKALADAS